MIRQRYNNWMRRFIKIVFFVFPIFILLVGCRNSATPETVEQITPTGFIYYIDKPVEQNHRIMRVDASRSPDSAEVVFTAGELAQIQEIDVFADGSKLIFSQIPSPSVNTGIFDRTTLSILDLTQPNPEPELILGGEVPNEFYNMPAVSPDGRYVFYTRLGPDREGLTGTGTFYGIERYDFETGEKLAVVPNSIWPQVSPDGTKLSFIILDVPTQQRGIGIVNIDASDPKLLIDIGRYFDIDSPIFSQDGQSLYMSIVEEQPQASLIERLLGIKVAYAHTEHNIPSTWWELPLDEAIAAVEARAETGEGERVDPQPINTSEVILINGRLHPEQPFMALSTTEGLKFLDIAEQTSTPEVPQAYRDYSQALTLGMLDWVDPQ